MKNDRDVIDAMSKSMSSMGMYIVLVFFAAQFVAFFRWTNFGQVFAVAGADFLQSIGLTGPLLFFAFILMCGFINLMIGSASAQWAVTAPIFVPMLMLVGYAPETIQAAYRIGDSVTNIITPMMSYFGMILAVATRYQKKPWPGYADLNHAAILDDLRLRLEHHVLCLGLYSWHPGRTWRCNLLSYRWLIQSPCQQAGDHFPACWFREPFSICYP